MFKSLKIYANWDSNLPKYNVFFLRKKNLIRDQFGSIFFFSSSFTIDFPSAGTEEKQVTLRDVLPGTLP